MTAGQPQQGQIQPQPVPTQIGVGQVDDGMGGRLVVVTFVTPVGISNYFLDPQAATTIGGQIRAAGKQAASGLIVPAGGGLVTP